MRNEFGIDTSSNIPCINPDHMDKNPSMSVYNDGAFCFTCGKNFDIFDITSIKKGLTLNEATEFLLGWKGFYSPTSYGAEKSQRSSLSTTTFELLSEFWDILNHSLISENTHKYLQSRSIDPLVAFDAGIRDLDYEDRKDIARDFFSSASKQDLENIGFWNSEKKRFFAPIERLLDRKSTGGFFVPLFDDTNDFPVSYRFRYITPIKLKNGDELKVLGLKNASHFILGKNLIQNRKKLVLCEGEPDWLTALNLLKRDNLSEYTAIGIINLSENFFKQLPKNIEELHIKLHNTEKAKNLSQSLKSFLGKEVKCTEEFFEEKRDLNDLCREKKEFYLNLQQTENLYITRDQANEILFTDLLDKFQNSWVPLSSGIPQMDKKFFNWLGQGDLIIIGGRPGSGKTSIAQNIIENVASDSNKRVVFFTLEMSAAQLSIRSICKKLNIDPSDIYKNINDDFLCNIAVLLKKSAEMDTPMIERISNINDIIEISEKIHKQKKIDLIVIDYLQRIDSDGENKNIQLSDIIKKIKDLAKKIKTPIIALSQLNRSIEYRKTSPQLSDLKDSGSIEQEADFVFTVNYNQVKKETTLDIIKNRHGNIGSILIGEKV